MNTFVSTAAAALIAVTASAHASNIYGFVPVTNNVVADANAGVAQLTMDVSAGPGLNQVSFTFNNAGPAAMSITDVYFDDGTLLGIASIFNGTGVSFSPGTTPPNLPGGNLLTPAFQTTSGFSADSNPPIQPNGVNPGETLTIVFDLLSGQTFADTIAALNSTGDHLRVGLHVQGFAGGGSEGFVNQVPAPGAFGLLGLGGLVALRRRR
jgi:MYXO-CTERM domain-containing protein